MYMYIHTYIEREGLSIVCIYDMYIVLSIEAPRARVPFHLVPRGFQGYCLKCTVKRRQFEETRGVDAHVPRGLQGPWLKGTA